MRRLSVLLPLAALAACGPQAPRQSDAEAIAQVKAAQAAKPPARPIAPQPILYFDVTQHKLYGSGCNFVPDGGGMGALVLAQPERAVLKLEDAIVTLAADKGGARLPQGAWTHYSGKAHTLSLTRLGDRPDAQNGVVTLLRAQVTITDPHDRVVYAAKGDLQCKPM